LDQDEGVKVIDLQLPIRTFWESEKILKHADYLVASAEDNLEVRECYTKLLRLVAPYAINEKDRNWIYERIGARAPST
jgi:hypothetical protein